LYRADTEEDRVSGPHSSQSWPSDLSRTVALPLLVVLALTATFRASDLDLAICRIFYDADGRSWPFLNAEPFRTLYYHGTTPAWILGLGGLALWLAGWPFQPSIRRSGLFFALMLAIGPGLMVNVILKPCWHRPRPNQVVHFGGDQDFLPVLRVGQPGSGEYLRSFPSGHASMGFYLMAPAFVLRRRKPMLAYAFLLLGLAAGLVMGLSRVAQGRHFLSDVVWSGAMVYFTAIGLYYGLGMHPTNAPTPPASTRPGRTDASRETGPSRPRDAAPTNRPASRRAA
jgi:membrane-associated PAP2 superfamily phosphatase